MIRTGRARDKTFFTQFLLGWVHSSEVSSTTTTTRNRRRNVPKVGLLFLKLMQKRDL